LKRDVVAWAVAIRGMGVCGIRGSLTLTPGSLLASQGQG
jgi:hypothetical protein